MTIKEKAIEKLDKEMLDSENDYDKGIYNWLIEQDKEELYKQVLEEKKSIANARQYIYTQACALQVGGCAIIHSDLAFLWIAEYYKSPVVEVSKGNVRKELTPQQKEIEKMKQKAKCVNTVKKTNEKSKKSEKNMMEGEQLDLLDFL